MHAQVRVEPTDYSFWIHVLKAKESLWDNSLDLSVHMVVSEWLGRTFFPEKAQHLQQRRSDVEKWEDQQIANLQNASALIFCIDANLSQASLLEMYLPSFLSTALVPFVQVDNESKFNRLVRWVRRSPSRRMKTSRYLNVDRFLLLLNKIDRICGLFDHPASMASIIDPVAQARDLLGPALMNLISGSLKPNCQFAVGVASAWGFSPLTGLPYVSQDGIPFSLATEAPDDTLRSWVPFGVRDALSFVSTGQADRSVKLVTQEDLLTDGIVDPIEVFYR
jgi:hypothetical protein